MLPALLVSVIAALQPGSWYLAVEGRVQLAAIKTHLPEEMQPVPLPMLCLISQPCPEPR